MSQISSGTSGWTKRVQRKLHLSVIACGATGTGKTTFLNTLVGRQVLDSRPSVQLDDSGSDFVLRPTTVEVKEEDGTNLVLTLIDTPGLGTRLDTSADIEALAHYIENRFDEVLAEESRIRRNPRFKDDRVDACLYFIEPTGHGLRELDIRVLQRLGSVVNIIPVLARADSLTPIDKLTNKRLVMEDVHHYDIKLFDFVGLGSDEELDTSADAISSAVVDALPLSVIGCTEYDANGNALWLRRLAHGTVEILNPDHCDFKLLKDTLLGTHLVELRETTRDVLYERYRTAKLDPRNDHRSSLLLPQELAEHSARLKEAQIKREHKELYERDLLLRQELEDKRRQVAQREQELIDLEMQIAEKQSGASGDLSASVASERRLHQSTSQQLKVDRQQLATLEEAHRDVTASQQSASAIADPISNVPAGEPATIPAVAPRGPRESQPSHVQPLDTTGSSTAGSLGSSGSTPSGIAAAGADAPNSPASPPRAAVEPDIPQRSPERPLSFVHNNTSPLQIKKSVPPS